MRTWLALALTLILFLAVTPTALAGREKVYVKELTLTVSPPVNKTVYAELRLMVVNEGEKPVYNVTLEFPGVKVQVLSYRYCVPYVLPGGSSIQVSLTPPALKGKPGEAWLKLKLQGCLVTFRGFNPPAIVFVGVKVKEYRVKLLKISIETPFPSYPVSYKGIKTKPENYAVLPCLSNLSLHLRYTWTFKELRRGGLAQVKICYVVFPRLPLLLTLALAVTPPLSSLAVYVYRKKRGFLDARLKSQRVLQASFIAYFSCGVLLAFFKWAYAWLTLLAALIVLGVYVFSYLVNSVKLECKGG